MESLSRVLGSGGRYGSRTVPRSRAKPTGATRPPIHSVKGAQVTYHPVFSLRSPNPETRDPILILVLLGIRGRLGVRIRGRFLDLADLAFGDFGLQPGDCVGDGHGA